MPSLNYTIKMDLSSQLAMTNHINAAILPLVSQAVNAIAQATQNRWQAAVAKAPGIWDGERDAYRASISYQMTGDFSAVVEATYKYAQDIETGRPARDLKAMLNTSMKVRNTKSGKRYLIIPMRHNTAGNGATAPAMSPAITAQAKMLSPSSVTGRAHRPSGTGAYRLTTQSPAMVSRRSYAWGERLAHPDASKNEQGMVRMHGGTRKSRSSTYLTFRVMMEGSSGWIIPAKPGQYIAKGVVETLQPLAEKIFAQAIKQGVTTG